MILLSSAQRFRLKREPSKTQAASVRGVGSQAVTGRSSTELFTAVLAGRNGLRFKAFAAIATTRLPAARNI